MSDGGIDVCPPHADPRENLGCLHNAKIVFFTSSEILAKEIQIIPNIAAGEGETFVLVLAVNRLGDPVDRDDPGASTPVPRVCVVFRQESGYSRIAAPSVYHVDEIGASVELETPRANECWLADHWRRKADQILFRAFAEGATFLRHVSVE